MTRVTQSVGDRFGRLVLVRQIAPNKAKQQRWECLCDCGISKFVALNDLRTGHTRSCGCIRLKDPGEAVSKLDEYAIFRGIIARCENPNVIQFEHYGGRGIIVSPLWRYNFQAFVRHVGPRPSDKHQIDRIDNNGNYEPGNVRWVLPVVQANNKRHTRKVVYQGRKMPLCDAVRLAGSVIHHEAAWIRIKHGWPVALAVQTPRLHESHATDYWAKRRAKAALGS